MKKEVKFYYVYIITNFILNKQYVGSKICYTDNPNEDNYWGSSKTLKKDIEIYGISNFKKEIIKSDYTDKISMLNGESEYIIQYNTLAPNGYNRYIPNSRIGFHMGGCKHSEETKIKMRKPHGPWTEEQRNKIKGRIRSEEHKKHLSEAALGISKNKGRIHTEESKKNMSIAHLNIEFTLEHKQNISKSGKGKKHKFAPRKKRTL